MKNYLYKLFSAFYFHYLEISRINLAYICLLPKKELATTISSYRPISLINCSFKLITKTLADRVAQVIDCLIDDSQTAFIKGRNIMDNVVCGTEVLHKVRIARTKGILFKLDFEKVYELIHWSFLIEILGARVFGQKFQTWIYDILKGSKTCISLMVF